MKAPHCPFNEIVGKIQVLTLEVRTALSMEEVLSRLKGFFGVGGLGLELKETHAGRLIFTGGGGHVTAAFCAEAEKTLLKIVTSGWAVQVKKFIDGLP
jgi:hypothetical protein